MKAMVLRKPADVNSHPLEFQNVLDPKPRDNEVLVEVDYCGVCRTDLHVVEGDLPSIIPHIVPGHEIVGRIVEIGTKVSTLLEGEIVGIPWLRHTCGRCEFCITSRENLCGNKMYTVYTVNGGYAQFTLGEEGFVITLPKSTPNIAPFLCAGIIGYRAFKVALPRPGGTIGFIGFGGSAHLTMQLASKMGYETVAYSRNPAHLKLASELGASRTVLTTNESLPSVEEKERCLDGAIVFSPAGETVLQALSVLKKGGILSIAAIHMSPIPQIEYDRYFFGERKIMSVESNTRADAQEFLDLAQRLKLESTISVRSLLDANEALIDLKNGKVVGANVLDCRLL